MASHFAALKGRALDARASAVLTNHPWPGNVRELRQVIERAGWLADDGVLSAAAVAHAIALGGQAVRSRQAQSSAALLQTCAANGWQATRTAAALGIGRTTLYLRLRALGISLREHKKTFVVRDCSEQSGTI